MGRIIVVSTRSDVSKLRAKLDDLAANQLPFASALALTATAREVARAETEALSRSLDRPTPFTRRAIGSRGATKKTLAAEVFIKRAQARYLAPSILGLRQIPPREAVLVPKGAEVNAYGNLPRRMIARLKARKDVFVGTVREVPGVWQRLPDGKLKLLVRFTEGVTLARRFDFDGIARAVVEARFAANLSSAITRALATAK